MVYPVQSFASHTDIQWLIGRNVFLFYLAPKPLPSLPLLIVPEHVPIYPDRTKSDMVRFPHQERQGTESILEGINCHWLSTACQLISLSVIPHLSLSLSIALSFFIPHCMMPFFFSFGCFPSGSLNHTLENLSFFICLTQSYLNVIYSFHSSSLILIRVVVDPKPTQWTLGARKK